MRATDNDDCNKIYMFIGKTMSIEKKKNNIYIKNSSSLQQKQDRGFQTDGS